MPNTCCSSWMNASTSSRNRSTCAPHRKRVNWLMTSVVNNGASVALIGSKNFTRMLEHVERKAKNWGSEQFHGRIKLRTELPGQLGTGRPESDCRRALARQRRCRPAVAREPCAALTRLRCEFGKRGVARQLLCQSGRWTCGLRSRPACDGGSRHGQAAEAAQTSRRHHSRYWRGGTAKQPRIARVRPPAASCAGWRERFHRHTVARIAPVMRPALAR